MVAAAVGINWHMVWTVAGIGWTLLVLGDPLWEMAKLLGGACIAGARAFGRYWGYGKHSKA